MSNPSLVGEEIISSLAHRASGMNNQAGNPRLKAIMERVLGDLFRTMADFEVQPDEAWAAVSYLASVGRANEAGLLAPGLGIEHFLDLLMDATDARAGLTGGTPRTIEGPLYIAGAPLTDGFARLDDGTEPDTQVLIVEGIVRDLEGAPLAGAIVDVWHANTKGNYSHFDPSQSAFNLRRRIRTDAGGRYRLQTTMPSGYGCPPDGPTQQLLSALGRHGQRPSHVHFFVSSDGFRKLTTQFNIAGDPLTYDDFAFATRDELVAEAVRVEDAATIAAHGLAAPFAHITFDFALQRDAAGAAPSIVTRERASA